MNLFLVRMINNVFEKFGLFSIFIKKKCKEKKLRLIINNKLHLTPDIFIEFVYLCVILYLLIPCF